MQSGLLLEHAFRFAKSALGWHKAAVRSPAQFARWTWIVVCAISQLRLARALAEDHRHAWERRRRPGRLTPGRVRRDFPRLAQIAGTPQEALDTACTIYLTGPSHEPGS